jgi:hypothetical protein
MSSSQRIVQICLFPFAVIARKASRRKPLR